MKILRLSLMNFRGIKSSHIDFRGKDTDIYGANGVGKTTIANAICYLLIDRPATEEKEFNPKTAGLKEAHHIAEMRVKLESGEEMTLKKDFYEKYTKKKGAAVAEYTGNVVDYYIDGVKSKQKDYNATIERILGISLDKAKMLLVLSYFTESMKTEEKRKILFELAEEFTDEDVFNTSKELQDLKNFLKIPGNDEKLYTIEQWKSIACEQRRKLNKDLELIPTRIDEATKSLPENLPDIEGLKGELKKLEAEKESLLEQKRDANKDDSNKAAIAALKTEIAEKRAVYLEKTALARQEKMKEIDALEIERSKISASIRKNMEKDVPKAENDLANMKNKRQKLVGEYTKLSAKKWDEGAEICPTCGQKLQEERIEELKAKFNRDKSERLTAINEEGQACSQGKIKAAEEKLQKLKAEFQDLNMKHIEVARKKQEIEAKLKEIPSFEETEEYKELQKKLEELATTKAKTDDNTFGAAIDEVKAKIELTNTQIAKIDASKELQKRIEELQKELKATSERLDYLDHGIYLAEEFTRKKAKMVTDSINKHFSITKFILFRDQINGGLKEVCEPTAQNSAGEWVEYRSLNFAAKVNSQLDIVNTLNKHYGVNLPVIIDQAESVTSPMKVLGQVIRLIVSPTDTERFRIEQV